LNFYGNQFRHASMCVWLCPNSPIYVINVYIRLVSLSASLAQLGERPQNRGISMPLDMKNQ
jgi:hypothetical protein